jgi:hypothetical protein
MKRLLPALALVLALAAPASAKELVSLSVCGSNGCHTTRDKGELRTAMDVQAQAAPDHGAAFYRVRGVVGEPGRHEIGVMRSQWIPSLQLLRNDDGPLVEFSLPYPETMRLLDRLSAGLKPFPAGKLGPVNGQAQEAKVDEVVEPPARATKREGAGGAEWPLAFLALIPAVAVFVMRRRGRSN